MPLHTLKALKVFVWEVFALHVTVISWNEAFSSAVLQAAFEKSLTTSD